MIRRILRYYTDPREGGFLTYGERRILGLELTVCAIAFVALGFLDR